MAHKIKEYHYKYGDDEILVKDHIGFFSGKEEILLNGEQISLHESRIFKLEKYDHVLTNKKIIGKNGNEFHLKVVCGMHLNFLPRTHIFVNGVLVAGDKEKPIYFPPCPWFCILFALSIIGLADIIFDGGPSIYKHIVTRNEIKNKIESNSFDLWQKEVASYLYKRNDDLRNKKKNEWLRKCTSKKDLHCRLVSYIYSVEGDEVNRLRYSLDSCLNNHPLSCYQAYLSKTFTVEHPNYGQVVDSLTKLCSKNNKFDDREKVVCNGFSRNYLRESGETTLFKMISKKLCDENDEYGCYSLQAINGDIIKYK